MKNLFLLALFSLSTFGATITNRIVDMSGSPAVLPILVQPSLGPGISGTNYVSANPLQTTSDTNGAWSFTLLSGDYLVTIGGLTTHRIAVPAGTNTYDFIGLINTNGLLYTFKAPGSVVKVDVADKAFGYLADKLAFSLPFTTLTNSPGTNESLTISLPTALTNIASFTLLTTNLDVLMSGGGTNRLKFSSGVLTNVIAL